MASISFRTAQVVAIGALPPLAAGIQPSSIGSPGTIGLWMVLLVSILAVGLGGSLRGLRRSTGRRVSAALLVVLLSLGGAIALTLGSRHVGGTAAPVTPKVVAGYTHGMALEPDGTI